MTLWVEWRTTIKQINLVFTQNNSTCAFYSSALLTIDAMTKGQLYKNPDA